VIQADTGSLLPKQTSYSRTLGHPVQAVQVMGACGDNDAHLLSILGRDFGRHQAAGESSASGRGWGRWGPRPCLPGLCEKLCHQVRKTPDEVSRQCGVGEGDLWALCRGTAETRGCGFSGST